MVVVFQKIRMPKIKGHVQDPAPREHRPGDFLLRVSLGPQVKHTKENEFLQRHMTKKATIHVGCAEGDRLSSHINFAHKISLLIIECLTR